MENPRVRACLGLDLPLEYQVVPPLLYLDGDTANIGKLFLNPLLMKVRFCDYNSIAHINLSSNPDGPNCFIRTKHGRKVDCIAQNK